MGDVFTFEQTPWELALAGLHRGDRLSAARFLTLLEDADEEETENAFLDLEEKGISRTMAAQEEAYGTLIVSVEWKENFDAELPEGSFPYGETAAECAF